MKLRQIVLLATFGTLVFMVGCSKGIGNNLPSDETAQAQASTNRPVGLDIGVMPDDPIAQPAVAGVVVPQIGSNPQREIVLLAFTTESAADDANGDTVTTDPISRQGETDGNGARDVFVAAVCAQDIDDNAFSQSLAGKFRHPRCTTCHSMQVDGTNAFVSATAAGRPHEGPLPGLTFPNNDPSQCTECHVNSTNAPVPGWQAPAQSFDLLTKTVQELADAAKIAPTGDPEHFISDARVLWALDSGILPFVGSGNGIADDDHDGIDEPSDTDEVIRTVPGGSETFIAQIEAWEADGFPVTSGAAVKDIILVSRQNGSTAAGNGASSRPQMLYVANGSFTAGVAGTVGTLHVVYESDASNLDGTTDSNGATDVYRTTITLEATASGDLSLAFGATTLVSRNSAGSDSGNGASTGGMIGGATADLIAFQSLATDLIAGFTDNNTATGADIYVRSIGGGSNTLVSHADGNATSGGDGASEAPSIDATGVVVAFESDATDLLSTADANGVRDVFYADVSAAAPFARMRASVTSVGGEGSGGASGDASVWFSGSRTLVAFESDKTDLAPSQTATTNVFLFDSTSGATTLLNQLQSATTSAIGDGSARNPVIGPDGAVVAFESDASNIDVLRADGNPDTDVFLVETAQALAGTILPYRFSLTTLEAADANGASTEPAFGTFVGTSDNFSVGFATYATAATNLGTSDTTNLVVTFLDETSGVVADFTATPTSGELPLTVQFTDTTSGAPTSWAWDFDNDGNVDSTEQHPSFTYTQPATYTVALTASNDVSSNTITKASLITVSPPAVTASFTTSPSPIMINAGDSVSFDASATTGAESYSWDFGDGSSGTGVTTSHTFNAGGVFTVTLTATGPFGNTDTETATATVAGSVTAVISLSANSNYTDQMLTLDGSGSSGSAPLSYAWDLDDDGMFDDNFNEMFSVAIGTQFPVTTPNASGYQEYTIRLQVTGSGGGTGVTSATFTSVPDAEDIELTAAADTTIFSNSVNNGNGAGTNGVAGNTNGNGPRRMLVRFDVDGDMPSNAMTINSAVLRLKHSSPTGSSPAMTGNRSFDIRPLTRAWTEGTEFNNSGPGLGSPAQNGGATWNQSVSGSTAWTTPGGDFGAASTSISFTNAFTQFESSSPTGQLRTDVQSFLDTPASNFGWILVGNESTTLTVKWIATRENGTAADRPTLVLNYTRSLPM